MGLKDAFVEAFTANGGEVYMVEAYKTGDVDFRAQFSKIKGKEPDVIFLPALYKDIALATSQARALGVESTFLGGDSWLNTDLFTLAPDAVNGSYYVNPLNASDPKLDEFKAKYLEKYNSVAGAEGGNCFFPHDAMLVLMAAIEKAQSVDPEILRDTLESIEDIEGLTGKISIDKVTHNAVKPVSVFKVETNPDRFEFVKIINP